MGALRYLWCDRHASREFLSGFSRPSRCPSHFTGGRRGAQRAARRDCSTWEWSVGAERCLQCGL